MPNNPYSLPEPWDLVASGYAETTMKNLRLYAAEAARRAELTRESYVLDVACGPGTLPLMIASLVKHVSAIDFSEDMLLLFRNEIERQKFTNIDVARGDGQALPYKDDSFDAAFSMFGLMFFPDREKGFRELHRTLKKKGRALVTAWAPVSRSPLMQTMFDAIQKITEETAAPAQAMASLEDPSVFRQEMETAGFRDVEILSVTQHFKFNAVEKFWEDMVKGSAPIVMLRKKMGETLWRGKERQALAFLQEKLAPGPVSLSSDAWLGIGVKR